MTARPPQPGTRRHTYHVVHQLARSIRERDSITYAHSCRVERLAYLFARSLGWPRADAHDLALAGLVHDLGKTWLENGILHKEAPLSSNERQDMQRHPIIGASLLRAYGAPESVVVPVLYHHERFDGLGYPDGLVGTAIPESARLLAIVDVFDALASPRPYKESMTVKATCEYLVSESTRYFDPAAVDRFLRYLEALKASPGAPAFPYVHT